jgi:hypothetical protein
MPRRLFYVIVPQQAPKTEKSQSQWDTIVRKIQLPQEVPAFLNKKQAEQNNAKSSTLTFLLLQKPSYHSQLQYLLKINLFCYISHVANTLYNCSMML